MTSVISFALSSHAMLTAIVCKYTDVKMLHHPCQPVTGTILVAGDQATNRELLEELLTAQGFMGISLQDGIAALKGVADAQVDLVLLDVMTRHLKGFEVCEETKTDPETCLMDAKGWWDAHAFGEFERLVRSGAAGSRSRSTAGRLGVSRDATRVSVYSA